MKKILKCKKCGKEIKAGEKFISEIIMPKSIVMPIGRLDTILWHRRTLFRVFVRGF
jgi:hypothetical protein